MGHKNVLTLRRNVLQLPELRQSRDLLVVILRLDIRAYCFNSSRDIRNTTSECTKLKFTETDYFRKIYRCNVQVNLNVYVWTSGTLAI